MSDETLSNSLQNKITNFVKKNFKKIIFFFIILVLILFGYFFYIDFKKRTGIKLSENYTTASILFKEKNTNEAKQILENIINKNHKFYSPLALYFIIDNNLESDSIKIIELFDKIISIRSIDEESLNLIKIKKAIFLFSLGDEKLIIETLNPVINSNSTWRIMAINLISDYFASKDQQTKANEYIQLLTNKIKK